MINTLMIEGIDVAFKYSRRKLYKNLKDQRVNITNYPSQKDVAGIKVEVIKRSGLKFLSYS